jgi:7,8-dihydropterin-6-yl-methyl-4-(beta-D-ribofuranosyl)aminobenzene 5'-phosphate synthase
MPRATNPVTLTIVYDNLPLDTRLKTAWGFACLVEIGETTVLFDTGGDGPTLMGNLAALGFDPRRIDAVVLSHIHTDHIGGLDALLAVNDLATVFVPRSFPDEFKARVSKRAPVIQVREPMTITENIHTTGEVDGAIIEQALIVQTNKGLVVITGCAHPGIVEIVRRAKVYGDVYLVMGGFHLGDKKAAEVETVIAELKRLGVRQVAPSHCTGEAAIRQFSAAFGADFIQAGAGLRIAIPAKD